MGPLTADLAELAELRELLGSARSALAISRASLERLEGALAAIEGRVAGLDTRPLRFDVSTAWAEDGAGEPADPALDAVVARVGELSQGCEGILRRPLRGYERSVLLGWAQMEREGVPVPVPEILACAAAMLHRPTPEGFWPRNLRWCDETVQTLRRGPPPLARPGPGAERSARYAALYERLADELDARERGA